MQQLTRSRMVMKINMGAMHLTPAEHGAEPYAVVFIDDTMMQSRLAGPMDQHPLREIDEDEIDRMDQRRLDALNAELVQWTNRRQV